MGLTVDDEYSYLHRESHRRGARPIGVPALIRHIAIWPDPREPEAFAALSADKLKSIYNRRRWNWFRAIDDFVDKLVLNVASGKRPEIGDATPPGESNQPRRLLDEDVCRKIAAEFRTDPNAPIPPPKTGNDSVFYSFRWHGQIVKIQINLHNEYATLTFSIDLSKKPADGASDDGLISGTFKALKGALDAYQAQPTDGPTANKINRLGDELFDRIWSDFESKFIDTQGVLLRKSEADYNSAEFFGLNLGSKIFADFRGIVLAHSKEGEFHRITEGLHKSFAKSGLAPFSDDTASQAIARVWPLVEASSGGTAKARNLEYAACTMLDLRVVYISSLGSESPYSPTPPVSKSSADGVRFFLIVQESDFGNSEFDRWQIGRLVARLNALGTLRLVALRDLKYLRQINPEIMMLGRRLDYLFQHKIADDDDIDSTYLELKQVFERLASAGKEVQYGILYRINRSRYAVDSYKMLLEDLRTRRIPGWQPYDEFVRRRLFSVFNWIDRLGSRIEGIRSRGSTLLDVIHASKLVHYQKIADILILPAGTYYTGYIVGTALSVYDEKSKSLNALIGFVIGFVIIVVWRFREDRHSRVGGLLHMATSKAHALASAMHRRILKARGAQGRKGQAGS